MTALLFVSIPAIAIICACANALFVVPWRNCRVLYCDNCGHQVSERIYDECRAGTYDTRTGRRVRQNTYRYKECPICKKEWRL